MGDLTREVAEILCGGAHLDAERQSEALERAEEIIDLLKPKFSGNSVNIDITEDDMPRKKSNWEFLQAGFFVAFGAVLFLVAATGAFCLLDFVLP